MTHARAYLLLSAVTLIWAGNYPLAKVALTEIGPITLAAVRAAIAVPLLLLAARALDGARPRLTGRDYRTFAVVSLTGLVGNTTLWYWGLKYTSPASAGILGASAPVLVSLLGALWLRDPLTPGNVAGMVLTTFAVMLTITRGSIERLWTLSFNRGDLIILASQLIWVSYTLYSRANRSRLGPASIQAGAHVISVAMLAPLAALERPWASLAGASWITWGVLAYSAGPITVGHLWYYGCVRAVGAGRAAVFMNLMPFVVIGLSWGVLGEPIRWYHVIGAPMVIAGVILATRR